MKELPDNDVLNAFSRGDARAFEFIFYNYHAYLFALARRYLEYHDAEDICSKCFMRLWESREGLQFNSMPALYGWLRTTARNSCLDYLERLSTRKSGQKIIIASLQHDPEAIYETIEKEVFILNRLREEIRQLPADSRQVFEMRWLGNMKFHEIAAKLHIDISTIQKRHAKAIKMLRTKLSVGELVILFIMLNRVGSSSSNAITFLTSSCPV